ncbi:MAG: hypothetical protein U0V48_04315 [Anaerolineales bacterium]
MKRRANLKEATELYLEEFPLKEFNRRLLTTFDVAVYASEWLHLQARIDLLKFSSSLHCSEPVRRIVSNASSEKNDTKISKIKVDGDDKTEGV